MGPDFLRILREDPCVAGGGGPVHPGFPSELQHHGAHRRGQLHQEGVRSTGGVLFRERLLVPTLIATGAY